MKFLNTALTILMTVAPALAHADRFDHDRFFPLDEATLILPHGSGYAEALAALKLHQAVSPFTINPGYAAFETEKHLLRVAYFYVDRDGAVIDAAGEMVAELATTDDDVNSVTNVYYERIQ